MFGFEGEVKAKYDGRVMQLFTECFQALPLAAILNKKVLILHGGLFKQDGVTIADIQKIDRFTDCCLDSWKIFYGRILWMDKDVSLHVVRQERFSAKMLQLASLTRITWIY